MPAMAAPTLTLKTVPILKTIIYSSLAGELLSNTGMTDPEQIAALQQCVSDGMVSRIIVRGRHPDGREETYTLSLKPFGASDVVHLTPEPGKTFFEMLDAGMAGGLQYAADQIRRLGLKPRYEVDWSEKAKANPSLVARAARTLNLKGPPEPPPPPPPLPLPEPAWMVPPSPPSPLPSKPQVRYPQTIRTYTAPPPLPSGFQRRTVVEFVPEKDPGVTFTIATTRKVT